MKEISFILVLAVLAVGVLRRPAVAIPATICLFGLEQWGEASGASLARHNTFTNYAIGVLVLVAVCRRALKGECIVCGLPSVYWLVLGLFAYALSTLAWTSTSPAVMHQWQLAFPYIATFIALTPLLAGRSEDLATAARWLIVIGGAISVAMLFFAAWGRRGIVLNPAYHFREANPLAIASMSGQVALTVLLFPISRIKLVRWVVMAILAPICLAVVVRSGSRGQLLGALAAFAIVWPMTRAKGVTLRLLLAPILTGILALIAYISMDYTGVEVGRWENLHQATSDVDGRLDSALLLLQLSFRDVPTLVFGLGNSAAFDVYGIYPHVVPVEIAAEEGLVGLGLFAAILFVSARRILGVARLRSLNAQERAGFAALSAGLIFQLVLSLKQGSMLGSPLLFMHAILVARFADLLRARAQRAARAAAPAPPDVPPLGCQPVEG